MKPFLFTIKQLALTLLIVCGTTFTTLSSAHEAESLIFHATEHQVSVTLFPAEGKEKHPAVLLLHGYQCIEACALHFQRYARALAEQGNDAYIINYYSAEDAQAVKGKALSGEHYAQRFQAWTKLVREVAITIAKQSRSDGRVALLGFSQGGCLAIASAANNPLIDSLVVFYARLPMEDEIDAEIKHLPPMLILHGDADQAVSLANGQAVLAKAKTLGNAVKMIVYPNVGHGFNFDATPLAEDTREKVAAFIRDRFSK